jgi:transcriptional regulator with XRE-family HTH domain
MLFGDRLKMLRIDNKMTQSDLGKALGISARVVGYYESNERFPSCEEVLVSIADYFTVSIDWLLGRTKIKSFKKDGSNVCYVDTEGLSDENVRKIKEYASMIRQFKKTEE